MGNYKILVLLSSYNGELYIEEQLDSILQQINVDVSILIRDDGSSDNTLSILNSYKAKYRNINTSHGQNIGYIQSFSKLVGFANEQKDDFDFFAFADQDDVWYKDKLYNACENLSTLPPCRPNLCYCNSELVDDTLKEMGHFIEDNARFTPNNIWYLPVAQGCSMVFNKRAVEIYSTNIPNKTVHDRWMLYICNAFGNIIYDKRIGFKYRIHANNSIGMKYHPSGLLQTLKHQVRYWILDHRETITYSWTKEFYDLYQEKLPKEREHYITIFINYRWSITNKLLMIFSPSLGTCHNSITKRTEHFFKVLLNKY